MNRALGLATVADSFHASAVCGCGRKGPGPRSRPNRHSITTARASTLRACPLRHPGWMGGAGADRGDSVRRRPVRVASPPTWVPPFQQPVCRLGVQEQPWLVAAGAAMESPANLQGSATPANMMNCSSGRALANRIDAIGRVGMWRGIFRLGSCISPGRGGSLPLLSTSLPPCRR